MLVIGAVMGWVAVLKLGGLNARVTELEQRLAKLSLMQSATADAAPGADHPTAPIPPRASTANAGQRPEANVAAAAGPPTDIFAALAGGASISFYAALLAAVYLYRLMRPTLVFALLIIVSAATVLLALWHGPSRTSQHGEH